MTRFVSKFARISSHLQSTASIESQKSQLSNDAKSKSIDAFNPDLHLILVIASLFNNTILFPFNFSPIAFIFQSIAPFKSHESHL